MGLPLPGLEDPYPALLSHCWLPLCPLPPSDFSAFLQTIWVPLGPGAREQTAPPWGHPSEAAMWSLTSRASHPTLLGEGLRGPAPPSLAL